MKKLTETKIKGLIKDFKTETKNGLSEIEAKNSILKKLNLSIEKKAVLGIDIYRYSQYNTVEQALIPFLFKNLMMNAIENCFNHEGYIFQTLNKKEFKDNFIDTGDGGFLFFDNPLQAVIFAIYFQANLKRYNSGHESTEELREIVGNVTLRYCLTLDDIYSFSNNTYGTGIINNARILAKDKLNRFLVDANAICWFDKELNGIENLVTFYADEDFPKIKFFDDYKEIKGGKGRISILFDKNAAKFISTDVLHIGEIKSKLDIINIYSIHIQVKVTSSGIMKFRRYTVSVGNLNSSDLI